MKPTSSRIFAKTNYSKYLNFLKSELFESFIDDDILQHVKDQMTQYSIKRNWLDINVSTSELKVLLAILLATKYNTLPRKSMYWSKSAHIFNETICN